MTGKELQDTLHQACPCNACVYYWDNGSKRTDEKEFITENPFRVCPFQLFDEDKSESMGCLVRQAWISLKAYVELKQRE